jgi:hypothetical protein
MENRNWNDLRDMEIPIRNTRIYITNEEFSDDFLFKFVKLSFVYLYLADGMGKC